MTDDADVVRTGNLWLKVLRLGNESDGVGAVSQSIAVVTAYDTLGEEGLTHSLQETNALAIFLDGHLIKSIVKPLSKTKDVKVPHSTIWLTKYVIYKDDVPKEDVEALKNAHEHLTITTYDELLESVFCFGSQLPKNLCHELELLWFPLLQCMQAPLFPLNLPCS